MMGYIETHKPNIVIMENVKNLMQKSKAWEGGHNLTHLDVAAKRFNTNSYHLAKGSWMPRIMLCHKAGRAGS